MYKKRQVREYALQYLYKVESLSDEKETKADKIKMYVRHQSVIYRKSLHNIYGTYVVAKNITISDYRIQGFLIAPQAPTKYLLLIGKGISADLCRKSPENQNNNLVMYFMLEILTLNNSIHK